MKDQSKQLDLVEYLGGEARPKKSHIWKQEADEHYCEPEWVNDRLFDEEKFVGNIIDPCAGFGRVVQAAERAGYASFGFDIKARGSFKPTIQNFLTESNYRASNIVMNPPFKMGREFVERALEVAHFKVAAIVPVARLNAAGKWLGATPLWRVWMLTPRPSMPPGSYITAGKKVGGGRVDFCWCVWLRGFEGKPTIEWLHRDGAI